MNKREYNKLGLDEKLSYYNKHTKNWNRWVCLIGEVIIYDWELYHVSDDINDNLFCYRLTNNGWNDKNKLYTFKRDEVIFTENNDNWL